MHQNNNADKILSTIYDDNFVRFRLVKNNPATPANFNWLFLPGGPGADSIYYLDLIEHLDLPGDCWLIDFPANGDNFPDSISADYDFNAWEKFFIPAIQRFENPILVGQSFGGMLPLLFPQLESLLKGFIIFNSAPRLWLAQVEKYTKENNIVTTTEAGKTFKANPNPETFKAALLANAPRHFPASSLEQGKRMFEQNPFNYKAMLWWAKKVQDMNFDAQWIPQQVPTLIMGGTLDFIVPCSVFETDQRFHRDNIEIITVPEAGHFLWMDQMALVKECFQSFLLRASATV